MSSSRERAWRMARATGRGRTLVLALAGLVAAAAVAAQPSQFAGIGRAATPKEIAAWDIDVRADFRGLPPGSGTVAKGMDVWEAKCASCHGVFGESNEVFAPIVGGTTKDDVKTGRAKRLTDAAFPGRTTMMKLSTVSTLWDYINRAMPWNAPKSLTVEEVYAVTAYLLNLGEVVPENFTLSHENIAQVQAMLPNRNGKTTDHGLWPGRSLGNGGKPDVKAAACMDNCATEAKVASLLPDFARNAHGNLAEQNRMVGPQHGADTTRPAGSTSVARATAPAPAPPATPAPAAVAATGLKLAQANNCMVCHGVDNKVVGPGMVEVAKKYQGRADALAYLTQKIKAGGSGVWGAIPMPAQAISDADAKAIAQWLADGAKR